MWPNFPQVLSCTEEGMRVGGGGQYLFFDKFYHPFHFMFDFYNCLT